MILRNGLRISPTRWPMAFAISLVSFFNSAARPFQELWFRHLISLTQIKGDPIFIIGHWRSGTTLLHELMVLDGRFGCPNTYECFAPNHFLVSQKWITKLRFLLPEQRPMDNMAAGWDKPQEDEFAICNLGLPSPYQTMAFPNTGPHFQEYLDFEGVSREEIDRWKAGLQWFLRRVSCLTPKQLVLKSPPHTGRIKVLLEMFPKAKFVHIVRDPNVVFPSTTRLWKTLYKFQALHEPSYEHLDEYVFENFERMYRAFEAQKDLIEPKNLVELRYEDLVRDPVAEVGRIYQHLQLGEFDRARTAIEAYQQDKKDYKPNKHQLDPELKQQIERRWGPFMRRYGYCQELVQST
jgi:LPS sulfotransferase NodH